jgi:hypothetical protein
MRETDRLAHHLSMKQAVKNMANIGMDCKCWEETCIASVLVPIFGVVDFLRYAHFRLGGESRGETMCDRLCRLRECAAPVTIFDIVHCLQS